MHLLISNCQWVINWYFFTASASTGLSDLFFLSLYHSFNFYYMRRCVGDIIWFTTTGLPCFRAVWGWRARDVDINYATRLTARAPSKYFVFVRKWFCICQNVILYLAEGFFAWQRAIIQIFKKKHILKWVNINCTTYLSAFAFLKYFNYFCFKKGHLRRNTTIIKSSTKPIMTIIFSLKTTNHFTL